MNVPSSKQNLPISKTGGPGFFLPMKLNKAKHMYDEAHMIQVYLGSLFFIGVNPLTV